MIDAIGALRMRVRLERPVRADDDIGGGVLSWSDEGDVWAAVTVLGASQSAVFDAAPFTASYRVTINRRDDVRAGWRVIWSARSLRIVGVRDDGAVRLELNCEEEML